MTGKDNECASLCGVSYPAPHRSGLQSRSPAAALPPVDISGVKPAPDDSLGVCPRSARPIRRNPRTSFPRPDPGKSAVHYHFDLGKNRFGQRSHWLSRPALSRWSKWPVLLGTCPQSWRSKWQVLPSVNAGRPSRDSARARVLSAAGTNLCRVSRKSLPAGSL